MKRHESLVALSRDHHDGLLLATRLQQGKKALLRLWSHDPAWQAAYVVKIFDEGLVLHFEAEEKVLFPLAAKWIRKHQDTLRRLLDEHVKMRTLVDSLRRQEGMHLVETLMEFGKILEGHIRCEEREFFPQCEEDIPLDELEDARTRIEQYRPPGEKQ